MSCTPKLDDSSPKISRIYFQFSIGCALADSFWSDYKGSIEDFQEVLLTNLLL